MIDKNELPEYSTTPKIEQLTGKEISILRRKVRDATKNNKPILQLKRAKKWSFEDRRECLSEWNNALSLDSVAQRRRLLAASGGIIDQEDDELSEKHSGFATDQAFNQQGGLLKVFQLITSHDLPTRKLALFKKHLARLPIFSLVLVE